MISLNDKITLSDGERGIVKYIGCIEDKNGVFFGIHLLNNDGKNNGTIGNISYFETTDAKSGKFVKQIKINTKRIKKQPNSTQLSFDSDVLINGTKGKVKYIGIPHSKQNKTNDAYYGIELMKSTGNSNGKFMKTSVSYFKCGKNKGMYIKVNDIDIQKQTNSKQSAQKQTKKTAQKQQNKIKNRRKRATTMTITKTVKLNEKTENEMNDLITSLPPYILKQWNANYNHIIHNKYKAIFIDILMHLNMMRYHLNADDDDNDEKNGINDINENLGFVSSIMTRLLENDNNNRILNKKDENVKKYCLNETTIAGGMVTLLKYLGWDEMKEIFVFFCDGIDSKITVDIDTEKKKKKKKSTVFVENAIEFLNIFMQNKGTYEIKEENEAQTEDKIERIEVNDVDNADEFGINNMSNYSLSIIEKLFEKRVRENEEKASYNMKSFESEIPVYAKKIIIYDTLNITIYKYEWESWPKHEHKYLLFRAETDQFVRFLLSFSFDNMLKDDISLASDKDDIIMTALNRRTKSSINKNENDNGGRIEVKIRFKPYQKRDLFLVKLSSSKWKWNWKIQQRNTSKKDNNIYLKLAEKLLKRIKVEYDELYTNNKLNEITNKNELHKKLFDELNVPFFMDMDFVPFNTSIMSKTKDEDENKSKGNDRYAQCFETSLFKRVIDMKLRSDYKSYLFSPNKDISFRNIEQGNLPNCGFVASLVSVALKKGAFIKRNIFNIIDDHDNDYDINEHGLYKLNMYFNGVLTQYCIDDFIPSYCYGHKQPSFTKHLSNITSNKSKKQNKYNIIWVLLLEKCLAKMHGGYDRLSSMSSINAFAILTGYPCVEIDYITLNASEKENIIWHKLMNLGNNKDILLTSSAHPKRSKRSINDLFGSSWKRKNEFYGMFAKQDGHCWSVIRVVECGNIKLICLRNPWGETLEDSNAGNGLPGDRWKGKYSRYDTMSWNKDLMHKIEPNLKKNDGTFWMNFNDYLLHFYGLNICYCLNDEYDRYYAKCDIKYSIDDENKTENIMFPKVIIDITLNEEKQDDDDDDEDLILEWIGIIQNDIVCDEYLDLCLFIGTIGAKGIEGITLQNVSSNRINYGTESLKIKLKPKRKYILIPYSCGHLFCCENSHSNVRSVTMTAFICGNKNNKYNLNLSCDDNACVDSKQMYSIFSNYINKSKEFKKSNKQNGDFVFTEKKFNGMIIAAWFHTKSECKFKTKIKFKLNNCLPAVGFDYNRYLMRNRKKLFAQNGNENGDKIKNKHKLKKESTKSIMNKKYSWNVKIANYASNQMCLFVIKKHRKDLNHFGYQYAFDEGAFETK